MICIAVFEFPLTLSLIDISDSSMQRSASNVLLLTGCHCKSPCKQDGKTTLTLASESGHLEIVKFLVDNDAVISDMVSPITEALLPLSN